MSRLRATLSNSPIDRDIQGQVAVAERALQNALRLCLSARKDSTYKAGQLAKTRRDLERALGALTSVRRVVPGYDLDDPDLQPLAPYEPPPVVAPPPEPPAPAVEEVE